jgi:hypothetical protein
VSEEDGLGVEVLRLLGVAHAGELVPRPQGGGPLAVDDLQGRLRLGGHHDERDGPEEARALTGGREAGLLELTGDVRDREFLAPAADAAALERRAGQVIDITADALDRNGGRAGAGLVRKKGGLPEESADRHQQSDRQADALPGLHETPRGMVAASRVFELSLALRKLRPVYVGRRARASTRPSTARRPKLLDRHWRAPCQVYSMAGGPSRVPGHQSV